MLYPPFVLRLKEKPVICYVAPSIGLNWPSAPSEDLAKKDICQVFEGLEIVITSLSFASVDFVIGYFWRQPATKRDLLCNLLFQRELEADGPSAPCANLSVWRNCQQVPNTAGFGNLPGDFRIALGREEEWRRLVMGNGGSLEDYMHWSRPSLPEGLVIPWPG